MVAIRLALASLLFTTFIACGSSDDVETIGDASGDATTSADARLDGTLREAGGHDASMHPDASAEVVCTDDALCANFDECRACTDSRCCIENGGSWGPAGGGIVDICTCPTGQQDVPCSTDRECLSECVADPGPMGQPNRCEGITKGKCRSTSAGGGCYCRFDAQPGVPSYGCTG